MYYVVFGENIDDSLCLMPPQWRTLQGNVMITKGLTVIGQSFKHFSIAISGHGNSIRHIAVKEMFLDLIGK